jgi:uncharacterized protein YoxC
MAPNAQAKTRGAKNLVSSDSGTAAPTSVPPPPTGNDGIIRQSPTYEFEFSPAKPGTQKITTQDLSKSVKLASIIWEINDIEAKASHPATTGPASKHTPSPTIEELLFHSLVELQTAHDTAHKENASSVKIDWLKFQRIGRMLQRAWDQSKTAKCAVEENTITDVLNHIQTSIANLEKKYEAIETAMTKETQATLYKLNEIQATTQGLENKCHNIENTVKDVPKAYADIAKSSNINAQEKSNPDTHAQHKQHSETRRQKRPKHEVTLSTRKATGQVKESISTMSPKEITRQCQKVIEKAAITDIQLRGISKTASGIRIQCQTEEQVKQLHTIDWNGAFEGMRIHEPKHGIVIRGTPIELDLDNEETIKEIESNNGFTKGTILKITPLRRKNNEPTNQNHRAIIIYLSNPQTANSCIENGCYIDYLHYRAQRFNPQLQVTQCYNCYGYGHLAENCKQNPRCGKCAETHKTNECNNTTVQCVNCKGQHEARCKACLAWIAENDRLKEYREHRCDRFTI